MVLRSVNVLSSAFQLAIQHKLMKIIQSMFASVICISYMAGSFHPSLDVMENLRAVKSIILAIERNGKRKISIGY